LLLFLLLLLVFLLLVFVFVFVVVYDIVFVYNIIFVVNSIVFVVFERLDPVHLQVVEKRGQQIQIFGIGKSIFLSTTKGKVVEGGKQD
jgi:hypothetical protein